MSTPMEFFCLFAYQQAHDFGPESEVHRLLASLDSK
jgi:hypothetical protein